MTSIIAFVGLPGSGKSVAARALAEEGYTIIRLGDITDEELKKRKLEPTEENEAKVREELRKIHGMDAYAKLNLKRIQGKELVVIDGLRSFEEYQLFRSEFGRDFRLVSVESPQEIRYARMARRRVRGLTEEECMERDVRELDILGVGRTLQEARERIANDGDLEMFIQNVKSLLS